MTCTWRWKTVWEIRLLLATNVPSAPKPPSMAVATRRATENTGPNSASGSSGSVTTCWRGMTSVWPLNTGR